MRTVTVVVIDVLVVSQAPAIIIVFMSVISIAVLVLVVALGRNTDFLDNIDIIKQAKQDNVEFGQIRAMFSTLVIVENNENLLKENEIIGDIYKFLS